MKLREKLLIQHCMAFMEGEPIIIIIHILCKQKKVEENVILRLSRPAWQMLENVTHFAKCYYERKARQISFHSFRSSIELLVASFLLLFSSVATSLLEFINLYSILVVSPQNLSIYLSKMPGFICSKMLRSKHAAWVVWINNFRIKMYEPLPFALLRGLCCHRHRRRCRRRRISTNPTSPPFHCSERTFPLVPPFCCYLS